MTNEVLVRAEHISKYFRVSGGRILHAVEDVSLDIHRGETLGLVGESGCGKSTLGRTMMGIYRPTKGKLFYAGKEVDLSNRKARIAFAKKAQIIFQDPYASLDPRMTVGSIIAEGMQIHKLHSEGEQRARVERLLDTVGLNREHASRFPHEFSGGQRQRIGVARAIALNPQLVVCDEPVSALDVSTQAQILNLMQDLQIKYQLTYIFISHNLSVVKHLCDRIAVMYLGHIVELADKDELFANALHPYTQALLASIPVPDPDVESMTGTLTGDVPSPLNPPPGCCFHTRCPYATDACRSEAPQLKEVSAGHFVACPRAWSAGA